MAGARVMYFVALCALAAFAVAVTGDNSGTVANWVATNGINGGRYRTGQECFPPSIFFCRLVGAQLNQLIIYGSDALDMLSPGLKYSAPPGMARREVAAAFTARDTPPRFPPRGWTCAVRSIVPRRPGWPHTTALPPPHGFKLCYLLRAHGYLHLFALQT
ncbi:hypothetical protein GUJ93_ZPchr0006g42214 [Zizania palustris]|uniref:Uncharacterized protein n=1 Tax=Zizania palustris TaxID=103762 RepID=A0A8J5T0E5_ZIZPA|nr:hypothetical protein GUJ93_ZPchr0006g42214 [Zizania palustris]